MTDNLDIDTKASTLNAGQLAAADGFFEFLFTDEKKMRIRGPGGVGKTHLMSYLIDKIMPQYFDTCKVMGIEPEFDEVVMTAMTNKAAEVLSVATGRPVSTIHSFMNLKVQEDYTNGRSKLTPTNNYRVHEKKVIFIDEASMFDTPLSNFLREGTKGCKIVFVGDHCQLAPVFEKLSPAFAEEMREYDLTQPMRTSVPELQAINQQLRDTVETGIFKPIQIIPGIIDHLDNDQMMAMMDQNFGQQNLEGRILAYTNKRVINYNDYIREIRLLPPEYTLGEQLVCNSAIQLQRGQMMRVEEEVTIIRLGTIEEEPVTSEVNIKIQRCDLVSRTGAVYTDVKLPMDRKHHTELLHYLKANKQWQRYYHMQRNYPDLRPRDAATAYKAQGSSYTYPVIDLTDISECRDPDQAARLMYVAFSRARERVYLFGNLATKYGGLIH